jgi:translocation and assembly module TamB
MRKFVYIALALMLALAIFQAPVLAQDEADDDPGVIARFLQDTLSEAGRDVRIRGFSGALSSRATIAELSIADDEGVWLVLRDVVLDWNRSALFQRIVSINELAAGEIEVRRPPATPEDDIVPSPAARPEFQLPELPVSITVRNLRADSVTLGEPILGQEARLRLEGAMQLEGGEGEASFRAERIDGQEGVFRFEGSFDNEARVLAVDLQLSEGPDGIAARALNIPDRPSVDLRVVGDGPLSSFSADIHLGTDGEERVSGTILLDDESPFNGEETAQHFELDVAGDLRPLLDPSLHPLFGTDSRLRTRGSRAEDGAVNLYELTFNTRTVRLAGRADFAADGLPRVIQLIADVARPDGEPVVLPGSGGAARLSEVTLNIDYDAEVSADWFIDASIDELLLPDLSIADTELRARGQLAPPATPGEAPPPFFDGVFEFSARGISAVDPGLQQALGEAVTGFMSLRLPGTDEPVEISDLVIEGETVSLSARGQLDGTEFDGVLEAEAPSLGAFSGLAGRSLGGDALITGEGRIDFLTTALDMEFGLTATDLSIDQPETDRFLAGESTISASVHRDEEGTILRDFTLSAGTLTVEARGQHRPEAIYVETEIDIGDLARLGPGYGGSARLEARFDSDGEEDRRVTFDGVTRDIRLGELPGADEVGALLRGATELSGALRLEENAVTIERLNIDGQQVVLDARGRWSETTPDIQVRLDRLDLDGVRPGMGGRLEGEARYFYRQLEGRVLSVQLASDGGLRIGQQPIDGMLSSGIRLSARVLQPDAGGLVIEAAQLDAQGLRIAAEGQQTPEGEARFDLTGTLDNLGRVVAGLDGPGRVSGSLSRGAGSSVYDTNFALSGPSGLDLRASGSVSESLDLDLRVSGNVNAAIANPFIEPNSIQGQIRLDATVQGPPAPSSVRGTANLSGGRFVAPGPGVAIGAIEARAQIAGNRLQLSVTGSPDRGGRVAIDGSVGLDARRTADLQVTLDRLGVAQAQLFEAEVSGQVSVTGPIAQGALVSGTVFVNEAEIRIPNSPLARAGFVPDGLRHVGDSAAARRTRANAGIARGETNGRRPNPLRLDLTLDAPGRVFIRGRGLDAELGGQLRLAGTTRDVIPSGSFSLIRGRLDLLGNRFLLTEGSASLVGSFVPYLRLVATTDSDGVSTSIVLEGEATSPDIRFTSVPELPEDEVLARLVFRRSLASLSPFQAAQLAMSVATLTGRSDGGVLGRTRQALGLDDLDFTTDAEGTTAVRAGRYITENIYTDLSVDSAGRSEVSINLDLTPSITVRGRTDSEGRSAVGVFFERDY